MIRTHYADLFADDPAMAERVRRRSPARRASSPTSSSNVLKLESVPGRFAGKVTYHDCCAGLRELGIKTQPRALLAKVPGLSCSEMAECETCCGFGGTFSIKFGEISARLADNKCAAHASNPAPTPSCWAISAACSTSRAGCAGAATRKTKVLHVAEVLRAERRRR